MPKNRYEAFEALDPFFKVVMKGLRGLANIILTRLLMTLSSNHAITSRDGP